jgi:CHASE2 domain-containing sensor protein
MPTNKKRENGVKGLRVHVKDLRADLIKLCVMAIPTALVTMAVKWVTENLISQPWQAIWIIFPLAVIVWVLWRGVKREKQIKPAGLFLWFFVVYVLIFVIAAGTRALDWQRKPIGYQTSVSRNWLSLNWAGDWRYWIVQRKPSKDRFLIITMERPQNRTIESIRYDLIWLIGMAITQQAKGIAFDFYLKDDSKIDPLLCRTIERADSNGVKVVVGYNFLKSGEKIIREFIAPTLQECLPQDRQGHLVGYAERDGKIRSIPLYFRGDQSLPALSYQFARTISDIDVPESGFLQFIPPSDKPTIREYEVLRQDKNEWPIFRDKYILVGERSEKDSFNTPYGIIPGVKIHMYAVHSLVENHFIRHTSIWLSLIMIFSLCLLLTLLASQGIDTKKLIVLNLLMTVAIITGSAAAIYVWLAWLDVIYPLVAIWLFLPLLLGLRRIGKPN